MHTKQLYEAPEAELLVVRFEENILSGEGATPFDPFGTGRSRARGYYYDDDEEDLY